MNGILLALEGVSMALEAIRGNKVRAALTIAGVAIGVFVVVAMGAVVNGIRASFQQDLEEIGATTCRDAAAASTPATAPMRTVPIAAIRPSRSPSGT